MLVNGPTEAQLQLQMERAHCL